VVSSLSIHRLGRSIEQLTRFQPHPLMSPTHPLMSPTHPLMSPTHPLCHRSIPETPYHPSKSPTQVTLYYCTFDFAHKDVAPKT
jgi:hypothetical protein